jgi:hypothetical protein
MLCSVCQKIFDCPHVTWHIRRLFYNKVATVTTHHTTFDALCKSAMINCWICTRILDKMTSLATNRLNTSPQLSGVKNLDALQTSSTPQFKWIGELIVTWLLSLGDPDTIPSLQISWGRHTHPLETHMRWNLSRSSFWPEECHGAEKIYGRMYGRTHGRKTKEAINTDSIREANTDEATISDWDASDNGMSDDSMNDDSMCEGDKVEDDKPHNPAGMLSFSLTEVKSKSYTTLSFLHC